VLDYEKMMKDLKGKLSKKFRDRPEIVEGNLLSVKRAYEEVRKG
jgi:pyruvate ferredoxin oxidoreductase gamma subunit